MVDNKIIVLGVSLLVSLFFAGNVVLAEPQFGGIVEEIIICTCGSNAGGKYIKAGDPHGRELIEKPGQTDVKDCGSPEMNQWVLGMSTENTEDCEQIFPIVGCIVVASGEVIDHYGQSKTGGCNSGLDGDASGDGKSEMVTPDGRTADGGDDDDGGPSGGASNATQSDTHLETVDGVRADGTVSSGGETDHMETSDGQNYEGANTSHMVIASDNNRDYEGNNDTVMIESGNGSGYSSAGGGRGGHGYGSIGGSVGSGGLQSPVVLGEKDRREAELRKNTEIEIASVTPGIGGVTNGVSLISMFLAVATISGSIYFIQKAGRKLIKNKNNEK